jgi:hypothetical protein
VAVKDDDSKGCSKGDSCEDSVVRYGGSSLNRPSTLTAKFFADGLWVDSLLNRLRRRFNDSKISTIQVMFNVVKLPLNR